MSRVRFEIGGGYGEPEQLVFVPMLFLAPLPLVPLLVAAGACSALIPDFVAAAGRRDRWLSPLGRLLALVLRRCSCWPRLRARAPDARLCRIYLLALAAQLGGDFAAA